MEPTTVFGTHGLGISTPTKGYHMEQIQNVVKTGSIYPPGN